MNLTLSSMARKSGCWRRAQKAARKPWTKCDHANESRRRPEAAWKPCTKWDQANESRRRPEEAARKPWTKWDSINESRRRPEKAAQKAEDVAKAQLKKQLKEKEGEVRDLKAEVARLQNGLNWVKNRRCWL